MKKDTLIDLDARFSKSKETVETEARQVIAEAFATQPELESTTKTPDLDAILQEWSWRCDKGYPNYNDKNDMIKLQEVLDEMGIELPFKRIQEAKPIPKKTSGKKIGPWTDLYLNDRTEFITQINVLYPKHGKGILNAFDSYIPAKERKSIPDEKLKVLNLFGTITDIQKLISTINAYTSNKLFQDLWAVSSVTGGAGKESETSGRGGLGKGEVLCVLLTKGGKSGGTSGTDLAGSINAEVKSEKDLSFKIPLNAARVPRLDTQKYLRTVFSWITEIMPISKGKLWNEFVQKIQETLPANSKMEYLKDQKIYFKAESVSDINGRELANLAKFFDGCNLYFYSSETEDDSVYVDLDTPGDDDVLMKAKLTSPKSAGSIEVNKSVTFKVISKDVSDVRIMKSFENKLKSHPYVKSKGEFLKVLNRTDVSKLVSIGFIVFQEPKGSNSYKSVTLVNSLAQNPRIVTFTLNQAHIRFGKSQEEPS